MKKWQTSIMLLAWCVLAFGQESYRKPVRPVKNVIVMIPDGTSVSVLAAARWYKAYNGQDASLNVDPYLCGLVKTHSSNAPIGDSAPTTSCYMTGMPQQSGNVAIYPLADPEHDLCPVDSSKAYRPLATVLEAAKIQQDKAVGLVVTCEFPHSTPADCSAHHYDRDNYAAIAPQMAAQNLNVMFGGGNNYVTDNMRRHFSDHHIHYINDDLKAFRELNEGKVWALFGREAFPYDLDRDTTRLPSIEEMTRKALELLSQNENGFFLMVEGSLIDWAAHANDAAAIITEFIAFDKAVGAVMDFARRDGNTAVIVLPDHGNSGFSIGQGDLDYRVATLEQLFGAVSRYKSTSYELAQRFENEDPEKIRQVMEERTGIILTDEEHAALLQAKGVHPENYTKVGESRNLQAVLTEIMNSRTHFGFTSEGHTGEDVFLAAYHPQGDIPTGLNTNVDINRYLVELTGLEETLADLTDRIFAKHHDVFAGMRYTIGTSRDGETELTVRQGRKELRVPAFSSVAYINGQAFDMGSVAVYIDRNQTFYLPTSLNQLMQKNM